MSDTKTVVDITAATTAAGSRKARGKNSKVEVPVVENGTPAVVEQPAAAAVQAVPAAAPRRIMKNEERHLTSYKVLRAAKLPVPVAAQLSFAYKEFGEANPTLGEPELKAFVDRSRVVGSTPQFVEWLTKAGDSATPAVIVAKVEEMHSAVAAAATPAPTPAS